MFRAISSLIIRSILTVITASGANKTRSCNYSCDASDYERNYRSKHEEQPRNNKLSYTVASCWSFFVKIINYLVVTEEIRNVH